MVSPNPDQTKGEAVDTRRPPVCTTEPVDGRRHARPGTPPQGTVFLVLGGGGTNGPSNVYGTDTADGLPQAKVITERNAISGSQAAGFTRNAADSIEDAPWSAATNAGDAYGYAIFDVDPGQRPRRDDDHLAVLRHPGGQRRGRPRARRHDHAADDAVRDVRLRPRHLGPARTGARPRPDAGHDDHRDLTAGSGACHPVP